MVQCLTFRKAMLLGEERLKIPAHQTDTASTNWDEVLDLGETRLPILVHVSEYSRAWNEFPHLVDFLGHHSWMNHFPSTVSRVGDYIEEIPLPKGTHDQA
jgi:hypothetical protein